MMKRKSIQYVLGFIALTLLSRVESRVDEEWHLRGFELNELTTPEDRDVFGISWTNLLFRMGVCHTPSETCPQYSSNSCGCPDCSKKLVPPHLHSYCKKVKSYSEGGGYMESDEEADESYAVAESGYDSKQVEDTRSFSDNTTTSGSRRFKHWILILVGAALVATASAIYMRRRETKSFNEMVQSMGDESGGSGGGEYHLAKSVAMANAGMAAAFGACFGGPKSDGSTTDNDDDDDDVSCSASVASRMRDVKSGKSAPMTPRDEYKIAFLPVQEKPAPPPQPNLATRSPVSMDHIYSPPVMEDEGVEADPHKAPSLYAL